MTEFRNESEYEFKDISSEKFRTYEWADGGSVTIDDPVRLAVSGSGHRLFTENGTSHYIPFGWKHLYWRVEEGEPHFVK